MDSIETNGDRLPKLTREEMQSMRSIVPRWDRLLIAVEAVEAMTAEAISAPADGDRP